MLSEKERFQRRTGEGLLCASAAIMIYALAGDPDRIGRHIDFNILLAAFRQKINAYNDSHGITNLIRYVL